MNGNSHDQQMNLNTIPSVEYAIASIFVRDKFAMLRLQFISRIIGVLLVALIASVALNSYLMFRSDSNGYVLTSKGGQIIPLVPLDQPNHSDRQVVDWTIRAVTELHTIDYLNFREQLQDARRNLTTMGWTNHQDAMILSGNQNAILGNEFVTVAESTGPGKILEVGKFLGRHKWIVEFPMNISYHESQKSERISSKVIEQNLLVTATVIRVPEYLNEFGLGVRSVIAENISSLVDN